MIHTSKIEYLFALLDVQPATCGLVAVTVSHNVSTSSSRLNELVRMGLATRTKFDPFERAPLSETERRDRQIGIRNSGCRSGKRPWLYELTPTANLATENLRCAMRELETATDDRQQQATA